MPGIARTDIAFAGVLAATGVLELTLRQIEAGRPGLTLLVTLCGALAMLLRSVAPLLGLSVTVTLVLLAHMNSWGLNLTAGLVIGCLLALGSVGRLSDDRRSVGAFAAATFVFVVGAAFGARPWDVVVAFIGCAAAWGAGRLLRREAGRNLDLRMLAADLVQQREVRAREAVQLERLRLARELHDTVAHAVSVMTLHVGGVRRRLDDDPERTRERDVLLDVEGLGREAVAELHRMLGVLRAPEEGLTTADASPDPRPRLEDLPQLAERIRNAGTPVELRIDPELPQIPPGLELTCYRVVQEALTNVLKHGGHASASVTVTCSDHTLEVAVKDDGDGPADRTDGPDRAPLGLVGIHERVALYGGHVRAGAGPGAGFEVHVSLPLPEQGLR